MSAPPAAWRGTLARLRLDRRRLRVWQASKFGYAPFTWFLDPCFVCVFLHRMSHLAHRIGHGKTARLFMQLNSMVTGADIQPGADIAGGLLVPSPCGVTLSLRAGENLTALALAGFGGSGSVRDGDVGGGFAQPVAGRGVTARQFTGIQGSIRLGDGAVVEPGAGAVTDVAAGARMVVAVQPEIGAAPARPAEHPAPLPACRHRRWSATRADFDDDVARYLEELARLAPAGTRPRRAGAILANPLLALFVYRLSHWLQLNGRPRLARLACQSNILVHKLTVPPTACLGGGVLAPHLAGALFAGAAGRNLTLFANCLVVGRGDALRARSEETPRLGDDVSLSGHCGIVGSVQVGSGVHLVPKAQLAEDAPAGVQVWSPMARRRQIKAAEADGDEPRDAARRRASPVGSPSPAWSETRRRMRRDRTRWADLGAAAPGQLRPPAYPSLLCTRLFRLSHHCHANGRPRLARWLWMANVYATGADIAPSSDIGGGLSIPHPAGVALHGASGEDLTVWATSGMGGYPDEAGRMAALVDAPGLGDAVTLWPHSGVYGPVAIGRNVQVMPGCLVTRSAPDDAVLVGGRLRFHRPPGGGAPPGRVQRP